GPRHDSGGGSDASDAGTGEGAASEGSAGDASSGPCKGAFAAPTLVLAHSNQYLVDSFTLTSDELEAFVALMPAGATTEQRMVYEMHRAHPGDVFTMDTSEQVILTNVGSTPGAFDVALTIDGLTLYFSHRQDSEAGVLGIDIYEAVRGDAGAPFTAISTLGAGIDDPTTNQFHAHPAGGNLYFTVAPVVSGTLGQRDLYVALLPGATRMPLSPPNGPTTQEANPVPSRNELELFFASDRANPGVNSVVYSAQRASLAATFDPPAMVSLSLADASTNVTPQYLTPDSCRLYVLVDQQDVYVSQRAP
ncbi:MAG TPA: hypothetical protein VIJ22_18890, partial [Polyangiaceae bacterium]